MSDTAEDKEQRRELAAKSTAERSGMIKI